MANAIGTLPLFPTVLMLQTHAGNSPDRDWRLLISILRAHITLADGTLVIPARNVYSSELELQDCVSGVMRYFRGADLTTVVDALPKLAVIYTMYCHRAHSTDEATETSADILRYLLPIDDLLDSIVGKLKANTLEANENHIAMLHTARFAFEVMLSTARHQSACLGEFDDFFIELRRPYASSILMMIYAALRGNVEDDDENGRALHAAELSVDPASGIRLQENAARDIYLHHRDANGASNLKALQRHALRQSLWTGLWSSATGRCFHCHADGARVRCTFCRRVAYCNHACKNNNAQKHIPACRIYREVDETV